MGDPKKIRKKYSKPVHPWQENSIIKERGLIKKYGLRNKKELWKMGAILTNFKDQAKRLIVLSTDQAEKEKQQLFNKLKSFGLLGEKASLDDVLGLEIEQILKRRLQSFVHHLDLAKTMKQARQFITHNHIVINGKKISSPSYLVKKKEENFIEFHPNSDLSDPDHPERKTEETMPKKPEKKGKKDKEKGKKKKGKKKEKKSEKKKSKKKDKKKQEEEDKKGTNKKKEDKKDKKENKKENNKEEKAKGSKKDTKSKSKKEDKDKK